MGREKGRVDKSRRMGYYSRIPPTSLIRIVCGRLRLVDVVWNIEDNRRRSIHMHLREKRGESVRK